MLTPHQRRDLLRIEQGRDAAITTAINQVGLTIPTSTWWKLKWCCAPRFEVVGMKNWVAAIDAFGRTPETNRQLLAAVAKTE
jgi:hypothetical protein